MTSMLALCALALFVAAAATDIRARRIPNRLTFALALVGLARISVAPGAAVLSRGVDLGAAAAVLLLGAAGFQLRLLGGGDVKLLAAGALWIGAASLLPYLMTTVLAGGILALGFFAWHLAVRRGGAAAPSLPYGVAIAAGGILTTGGCSLA
jgi:prepilin peptidase CpaA